MSQSQKLRLAQTMVVRTIRSAVAVVVVAAICAAGALAGSGIDRRAGVDRVAVASASGGSLVSCPVAVRRLGLIAFTARGRLELVDLASCREIELATGVAEGVRFSPDGRWLTYSRLVSGKPFGPVVIPARGGEASLPLGTGIVAWSWAPGSDVLYGVNDRGQRLAAAPGRQRRLVASGLGARYEWSRAAAPSPNGWQVVVNRSRCVPPESELDTIAVLNGAHHIALRRSGGLATFADWSPDGRWLLYWAASQCSSSLAADGWPLKTVVPPVAPSRSPLSRTCCCSPTT